MHQRSRGCSRAQEINNQIQYLRVQDRGGLEMLARRRRPGENENSRADDCPDPQRGQRPRPKGLLQPMPRLIRFGNQLVDGLAAKELAAASPCSRFGSLIGGGRCSQKILASSSREIKPKKAGLPAPQPDAYRS